MEKLRTMLLKEEERLERFLNETTERLHDAPLGNLRLSGCGKTYQYYLSMPGDKTRGTYIPKAETRLIRRLAQKSYDEKISKLAAKRLAQIRKITKDYEDDEIEKIYLKEHDARKALIVPVEPSWEQKLKAWLSEDYRRKEFQDGTPVIMTEKGERVRSKSEKIMADYFYRNGISYHYEKPLYLNGFGIVHPDFTFLSRETGQEIYWEHDGRMDDAVYANNAVKKIQAYEENDIYPGERLILTFETAKNVLDMRHVKKLAEKYLICNSRIL